MTSIREAKETLQALMELSAILSLGLDQETLSICVRLCEAGINPELLARILKELQKQAANESGFTDS